MKKSLLKKLTISCIFIFLFFAGLFSQDPVVTIEGYPEQEFPNVVDALEWIKTQKDITKATVLLPEGDILTPAGFSNMGRTVEITIQGAGADKSFIRGFADDEEMPKIGEKGRRFLNLVTAINSGSHWTFKDLTFLRWGVGDGNGGIIVNPKDIDIDLTFINCNFEQIQAQRGAIAQGMNANNTFTFDNCFIGYSKSYDKDGGMNGLIYKDGGNLIITNCTFMSNDRNPATTEENTATYISADPDSNTAELFIWGYLWSDSPGGNKTTWTYKHKAGVGNINTVDTAACVKRFRKAALLMGATITKEWRTGDGTQDNPFFDHISVRFPNPLNIDLLSMPPILVDASPARTSGFLAAVIEGEGNKKGLIIDDWYQAHHDVIKQLLDRMGVNHVTRNDGQPDPPAENKKFKKTGLVDEAGVIEVQKWPYVDWTRVPNRVDSWWE